LFKPAIGIGLTVACGLVLWATPRGESWVNASYDYLFRFGARVRTKDVVLIQMDNKSFDVHGQTRGKPWDRGLHARLLNRLASDGCRLLVMDVWFREAGDPITDAALAEALRRQRSVVLMADLADSELLHINSPALNVASVAPSLPVEPFLSAAKTNWGRAS
jgi:CHASE2 domain-containing sensor protein